MTNGFSLIKLSAQPVSRHTQGRHNWRNPTRTWTSISGTSAQKFQWKNTKRKRKSRKQRKQLGIHGTTSSKGLTHYTFKYVTETAGVMDDGYTIYCPVPTLYERPMLCGLRISQTFLNLGRQVWDPELVYPFFTSSPPHLTTHSSLQMYGHNHKRDEERVSYITWCTD